MSGFLRKLSTSSYKLSRLAADANAYQRGGMPRLAKRIIRRNVTRRALQRLDRG